MNFHVVIHINKQPLYEVRFHLTREQLERLVLVPYRNYQPIVLGGRTIMPEQVERIQVVQTQEGRAEFASGYSALFASRGHMDWFSGEPGARDVSDELITTSSVPVLPQRADAIDLLCTRFHTVAMQIRNRHDSRQTIDVTDEYDVQDLMHAMLRIFFEDIRAEEWTPSYAGKSSRMDFFLPPETVIETKKTRVGLTAKEIGTQLIEDIARYQAHQGCKRLVCFVYDPEGRIANPRGIEHDLSRDEQGFEVKVIIAPKGY
jgi:hypothetical protein